MTSRPIQEAASSVGAFHLVSNWLNHCLDMHKVCEEGACSTLPTRVIDVGTRETKPRLILTQGQSGSWISLSHCWGKEKPSLKTTTKNIAALCEELPENDIPLTWRDAILSTQKLGYKYL